jgi:hypothetical protein
LELNLSDLLLLKHWYNSSANVFSFELICAIRSNQIQREWVESAIFKNRQKEWYPEVIRFYDHMDNVTIPMTHTSLSPIRRGFTPGFVNYKKGCTRLAAASDKVYQLLAYGRELDMDY